MNLWAYCIKHGGTGVRGCPVLAALAADLRCSADTLYMIAHNHKRPSPRLARRIEVATAGEVTRVELRPDIFGDSIH